MTPPPNTTDVPQTPGEPFSGEADASQAPRIAVETRNARPAVASGMAERLRKPVSFLVAVAIFFLLVFVHPRGFGTLPMEAVKLAGFFLVAAGVLGRILCTLYIGGRKNRELCQTGIYAMCRNPLYFFSFLGLTGICLAAQNLTLTLTATSLFLILYRSVIASEERTLLRLFPQDFPNYQQSVPRFWPHGFPRCESQILQVDTRVFIRSMREVPWFLAALIGVEAIGILRSHGMIHALLSWY